jgi:hypothetical protein
MHKIIKCVHMYVNIKIPVKGTPGIGGGGIKEKVEGVNSCMIYLIHCKNLYKCHNVPPSSTTIKENYMQSD